MTNAPTAPGWRVDEETRARAIAEHDFDQVADGDALTRITDFAAALCEAPVALVSLVENSCQWFLARSGTDLDQTPRAQSFCQFAMTGAGLMTVPDATADPRFADNPLVTGAPGIRFYAGAPITTADGVPLGALCVIDIVPRAALTPLQEQGLMVLAEDVRERLARTRRSAD